MQVLLVFLLLLSKTIIKKMEFNFSIKYSAVAFEDDYQKTRTFGSSLHLRYLELTQLRGVFGYVGHYLQVIKAIGRESNLNFEKEELKRRERERSSADAI